MQATDTKVKQLADENLTGGQVRPKSKVQIIFKNSKHHGGKPYHVSNVHPALAEKLVKEGKAEYFEGKLSKDQIKENADYQKEQVKAKGRKPGKVTKKDEDEFDEDFDNEGKVMTSKTAITKK